VPALGHPRISVRGSNITPDPETSIGSWSVADLKRALVHGVRPSGVPLASQMPFAFYKVLTAEDLEAVVAYIRAVAPGRQGGPRALAASADRVARRRRSDPSACAKASLAVVPGIAAQDLLPFVLRQPRAH
jgi:hypothetical protein